MLRTDLRRVLHQKENVRLSSSLFSSWPPCRWVALYGLAAIVPGSVSLPSSPLAAVKAAFTYASQPLLARRHLFF